MKVGFLSRAGIFTLLSLLTFYIYQINQSIFPTKGLMALFLFFATFLFGITQISTEDDLTKFKKIDIKFWLCVVIFFAALIRLCVINFGLPDQRFHSDESGKIKIINEMLSGHSLNSKHFLNPSLLLYLTMPISYVFDWIVYPIQWDWSARTILAGRIVSCFAGIATVPLTYLIAKKITGKFGALFAAAIFAFAPLATTTSRYLTEDSLMTFWVAVVALLVLKSIKENSPKFLVLAGACVGLAASSKYPGGLTAIFLAVSPWIVSKKIIPDRKFLIWGCLAVLTSLLIFFAINPHIYLDLHLFFHDLEQERLNMNNVLAEKILLSQSLFMFGIVKFLDPGLTTIGLFLSILGFAALVKLSFKKPECIIIVLGIIVFYIVAEGTRANNARYLLPTLPFLSVCIGYLINNLILEYRRLGIVIGVTILVLISSRSTALAFSLKKDTRDLMKEWIEANIPKGSKIVVPFKGYAPMLSDDDYRIVYLKGNIPDYLKPKYFEAIKADYVIMSSLYHNRFLSEFNPEEKEGKIIMKILTSYKLVAQFVKPGLEYGYHNPDIRLLKIEPLSRRKLGTEPNYLIK